MATAAPSSKDVDDLKKNLATETKRIDALVADLNEVFKHAKENDDRIEKSVKALAIRMAAGGEGKRITQIVAKINEIFVGAKKNDDRIEAMVKALEAKVDALAKK
jgi:hypothetical protein